MQDRMHSADEGGWVMWVHVTTEGKMQVSVRAEQERSARAKIREWGRTGVRAVLMEGANEHSNITQRVTRSIARLALCNRCVMQTCVIECATQRVTHVLL
eukprot:2896574-Prymnesium_polylepis.1